MPVPSNVGDLNPNPAANSPTGNETVGPNLDDYLRAGFAFDRQIATDFVGDSEPANPFAYMTWAQPSTGKTFRRKADNTGWVDVGKILDRPLYSADGATGLLPTGGFRNKLINGLFSINQRLAAGTVVLVAGQYGHDRFKAGTGGCTYTFSTANGVTTLNITAGTLVQVVEGSSIMSGDHVLAWQGTAQGRIDAGAFGPSPVTATLVGGANVVAEFGTGTLSLPQLEMGAVPNKFELRPMSVELSMVRWYFRGGRLAANTFFTAHATPGAGIRLSIPIGEPMRVLNPSVGMDINNWQVYDASLGWTPLAWSSTAPESGLFMTVTFLSPGTIPGYSSVIVRNTAGANYNLSAEL